MNIFGLFRVLLFVMLCTLVHLQLLSLNINILQNRYFSGVQNISAGFVPSSALLKAVLVNSGVALLGNQVIKWSNIGDFK